MAWLGAFDARCDAFAGSRSCHRRDYVLVAIHSRRGTDCRYHAARIGSANSQRGIGCAVRPLFWLRHSQDCTSSYCSPVLLRPTIPPPKTANCLMLHPHDCISKTPLDFICVRLS